jgi:hypothetical protein
MDNTLPTPHPTSINFGFGFGKIYLMDCKI